MSSSVLLPLAAFAAAAGILTITPGVDTATVLRSSTVGGAGAGIASGLGICSGLLVWGMAAAFGLTALLTASELAFSVVKWAGAIYLACLGARLLLSPRTRVDLERDAPRLRREVGDAFTRGFLTNILNPKVGIFYVTFLPQFIPAGTNVAAFSMLLAGIHVLLTLAWFGLLIGLTVPLGRFLARPAVVKTQDRLVGLVFLGFGARLALADRG